MADIDQARTEAEEALKHVKLSKAYAETARNAALGAEQEATAAEIRLNNVLAALNGDVPADLPKASLLDAADTEPGQSMVFKLVLDEPATEDVTITVRLVGGDETVTKTMPLTAGNTELPITVVIRADAVPGVVTAVLSEAQGLQVVDAEAIGRVVVQTKPGDKIIAMIEPPTPITRPIDVSAGQWAGLCAVAMVVKYVPSGGYQKFAGATSSVHADGAFCIGMRPDNSMNVWCGAGGQTVAFNGAPTMPRNQATFVAWGVTSGSQRLGVGDQLKTSSMPWPQVPVDGAGVIGAGYWRGSKVDPLGPGSEIRAFCAWRELPTEAEITALRERWKPLIDDTPTNGGGGNGGGNGGGGDELPLEPVDQSALRSDISVDAAPRQAWHGWGWGCNATAPAQAVFPRVQANVAKLTTDIGVNLIRVFTPENASNCVNAYKPYWDLVKSRGVDTIFASSFLYRGKSSPQAIAAGVAAVIGGGLNAKHWYISLQNEPDGNPANAVVGDFVAHHRTMRAELDRRGLQHVKLLALEWRHPTTKGPGEFDAYDSAGMVGPDKAIAGGCLHIYDKAPDQVLFDQRYLKRGVGLWSTELGNNNSPGAQARMLAGINHGSEVEIVHYCQVATATPNAEQMGQALLDWNGNPRPWYGALKLIGLALTRGSLVRLCKSSDRPPGLPAGHAERMIRNAAQTGGRNPRHQVVAAQRPDGKWVILATSTTYGIDGFNPYTSGHYGAVGRQQLTVKLPISTNGKLSGRRANMDGGVGSSESWGMQDGLVRFTLRDGDTAAMVQA